MKDYLYQAEKFAAARRNLMLPHPHDEAASIANAYDECLHGLHHLNEDDLGDDTARNW